MDSRDKITSSSGTNEETSGHLEVGMADVSESYDTCSGESTDASSSEVPHSSDAPPATGSGRQGNQQEN